MEAEKRKRRRDDGEVDGEKRKAQPSVTPKVTECLDADVEEFFAILRRIHVAANYLKRNGRDLAAETRRSMFAIETDDLNGADRAGKVDGKTSVEVSGESHKGLDLNLDPPSEHNIT